jgi:hypothetical protein
MKETEDDLDFHYNREKRLEKAPEIVKNWYAGTSPKAPKGFFESFIHTKSSRILLGILVLVIICCGLSILILQQKKSDSLAGIPITLSAFSFEDTVYISLQASQISDTLYHTITKEKDENKINIHIKFFGEKGYLIGEQNLTGFYSGKEAFYRTTTPNYDIIKIETELSGLGSFVTLSSEVQKK